ANAILEQFLNTYRFPHALSQTSCDLDAFLDRHVGRESFLLAERFLRFAHGKDTASPGSALLIESFRTVSANPRQLVIGRDAVPRDAFKSDCAGVPERFYS